MGIRYYGYPLPTDLLADAWADPARQTWAADQRSGTDRWTDGYLDKAWRYLQLVLGDDRPAGWLVRGQVTDGPRGHHPYYGVLTPAEMRAVARDLERVGPADIRSCAERSGGFFRPDDEEYTAAYLAVATTFSLDVVSRGQGCIYTIR